MTEEKKEEQRVAYEYLMSLDEETRKAKIESFVEKRKMAVILFIIVSGLMGIGATVLTCVTFMLEALQGRKEQIVIAVITILIGTILFLCLIVESILLSKLTGKRKSDEFILNDYVASNADALYKEALKQKVSQE